MILLDDYSTTLLDTTSRLHDYSYTTKLDEVRFMIRLHDYTTTLLYTT